jgi:hypothetical protein
MKVSRELFSVKETFTKAMLKMKEMSLKIKEFE